MKTTDPFQHSFKMLKRQTLFVIFLCYFPHIATEPLWLFILFFAAMGYSLIADKFNYPVMPRWVRFCLFIGCLVLLYGGVTSSRFFIRCLLTFIILKCLEIRSVRDLKVIILCNFFLIFTALVVIQEQWILLYLIVTILANLSIMLKLSASQATLRQIGSKSGQQLLLAIPLSIILFYVFPRLEPLWRVPSIESTGVTGFSESMDPGSIAKLFNDDSVAMQITFKNNHILKGYWRGIVLSFFTGENWSSSGYSYSGFYPFHELKANETADYEIILEPNQRKWLFYDGYPVASKPNLLFSTRHGLIRPHEERITQRFAYSLKVQQHEPYHNLTPVEYTEATQLPKHADPRLNAWAKTQFAKSHNDVRVFIDFLRDYIQQQPFWYTLTPPEDNSTKDLLDSFWFDTQKGFCEHYASAIAFILRSVGVPARVIIGYYGGEWNPIANTISIHQSDAHAWLEYWQKDIGWQRLDPTSFIATDRIDKMIQTREADLNQENNIIISALTWSTKLQFYFEYAQFFTERWVLFYNQNAQQNLLQNVGLGQWKKEDLLQASVGFMILFFIVIGLAYQWWQQQALDALLYEYHLLQKEFQRLTVATPPSATLRQQCKLLINKVPVLRPVLSSFLDRYEQLRLKQSTINSKENKKETIALFKALRYRLRSRKPSSRA